MYNSVPSHIHPHLSKNRGCYWKPVWGINEQCLQWVPCILGTTTQDCSVAGVRNLPRAFIRIL